MLKPLLSLSILIGLIVVLNTKFGSVPPVGKFFDPDAGFWANAESSEFENEELTLAGATGTITVTYDERRVPHIFAENDVDLYLAQGFITARDRLFQMEMQTYDAAGRLSEIVGSDQIERDKRTRRWGMGFGAEKAIEYMKQDENSWKLVQAYSEGVNAYIESLSAADLPLEYKILNLKPEEWKPIKTALLLKNMTRTLGASNSDDRTSNTMAYFGEDFVEQFFSRDPELLEPIIPASTKWNFDANIPEAPDTLYVPQSAAELPDFPMPEGVGSNNWAVSGAKTASGYPILANDPHLTLTLPSIWYEVQLSAPGINTYGVSLQGVPGIIIGFNEDVAWGVTNVASDVADWYEIKFKDDSKAEYWHDNQWKKTSTRIEEIKVRDGETVLDTVIYTHHGPITESYSEIDEDRAPAYHALRWIAHYPSDEIETFYKLNRAENYDDYVESLSHYRAPAQNFVFASNEGDIAMWVNGRFPLKWENQGRTVSDGTDPIYDWQGWIPHDHNPHVKNPPREFVSSANQESVAPDYPYYLDDDFATYERGRRINDRLREMDDITKDDMIDLQIDNFNYRASTILNQMMVWVQVNELSDSELEVYNELDGWNFFYDADLISPGVFNEWWSEFYGAIFYDEYNSTDAALRYPPSDMVIEVLSNDPGFSFVDNIETDEVETIQILATSSFKKAVKDLTDRAGEFGDNWKWGVLINNDINHLAFIPGMGEENLYSGGSAQSVNATRGTNGPSWRMVVELGPEVKGWGVYPGGPSGNPGSPFYNSMVESWRTGELYELNFYREKPENSLFELTLSPKN
jgi:penicillin amidase